MLKKIVSLVFLLCLLSFSSAEIFGQSAQESKKIERNSDETAKADTMQIEENTENTKKELPPANSPAKDLTDQKYRLLQSNSLLVETAYHQEADELQHTISFSRTNRRNWSAIINEEIPLGSEKHQLSISIPAQLAKTGADDFRGVSDTKIEYSYFLYGDNSSAVTISPGFGVSLPTGSWRKELGAGAPGFSASVPVSVMLGKRFASTSNFEIGYTRQAKNNEGEKADLVSYEIGQSFVWYAKPKLNLLVEAVWERSPEVIGDNLRKYEQELYISPAVRWAYVLKNGLVIAPAIGVPIGVGVSGGTRGVVFSIAFEHSLRKGN